MAYREMHELPYRSGLKEKFFTLGPVSLSLAETGWVALGLIAAFQLKNLIPILPFSFPFSHIHYALPVVVTYIIAKAKHPRTGLSLAAYLIRWYAIRTRPRVFYYRKINI